MAIFGKDVPIGKIQKKKDFLKKNPFFKKSIFPDSPVVSSVSSFESFDFFDVLPLFRTLVEGQTDDSQSLTRRNEGLRSSQAFSTSGLKTKG